MKASVTARLSWEGRPFMPTLCHWYWNFIASHLSRSKLAPLWQQLQAGRSVLVVLV